MAITHNEEISNKPCCALLREKSRSLQSLNDPAVCTDLLECLEKHCVLMKKTDYSQVKFDEQYGQCYLLVDPGSTRQILNEATETITLEGLTDYYDLLSKVESSIAKSPLLEEIADHHTLLLATIREGEKKFGAVPITIEKSVAQSPELMDRQSFLMDHPRLADKPQFDGVPPSQTPIPNDNPDSLDNVNRLQHQHQPKPAFNPRPHMP
jgi:hypothetical protein